jgi:hypothetical protein
MGLAFQIPVVGITALAGDKTPVFAPAAIFETRVCHFLFFAA